MDQTQFMVDAESDVILTVSWMPIEAGNLRETVYMKTDQACRLQFVIVASATKPIAKRIRKV